MDEKQTNSPAVPSLKRTSSALSTSVAAEVAGSSSNVTAVKQQRDIDKLYLRFGDTVSFRVDGKLTAKESGCLTAQGFADSNVLLRPCPMTEVLQNENVASSHGRRDDHYTHCMY